AVRRRARAGDVGAEGAERAELVRERRGGEIVRRQGGEVARAADGFERVDKRRAATLEVVRRPSLVELRVDVRRRALHHVARKDEQDPVVLRQVERLELAAVPGAEVGTVAEQE